MFLNIIALSTLFVSSFASIKDCDTTSIFRPTQLALSPDPPIPGQPIKLTLIFDNTGNEITEGSVTTTINLNGIPFSPTTNPLCDNTICPITPGNNDRSTETTFPDVSGIIKSRVTWSGPQGESLLCIDSVLKVPSDSWNPFSIIRDSYINNKHKFDKLFDKFKHMAEDNNLRGIIDEINEDSTKTHKNHINTA